MSSSGPCSSNNGRKRHHETASAPPPIVNRGAKSIFIAVWIPKGGVGKSTMTFSLGYALIHRGYNVLLVDCDSQRDLTNLCLKKKFAAPPYNGDFNAYINRDDQERTLHDMLQGLNTGPHYNLDHSITPEVLIDKTSTTGSLHLLPGHRNMDLWDAQLSTAESLLIGEIAMDAARKPGAPHHAIRSVANNEKVDADIVLLDLHPGKGTLTRLLLMSSDYFLVPTMPDYFSKEAVNNMMMQIAGGDNTWLQYTMSKIIPKTSGCENSFPNKRVKFLGFTISDYTVRNKLGGARMGGLVCEKAPRNMERWMNLIYHEVLERVDQNLLGHGLAFSPQIYRSLNIYPYLLCKVRNFNQLQSLSHYYGVPVPYLQRKHCKLDDGNGLMKLMTNIAANEIKDHVMGHRRNFDQLAWNVLSLIAIDLENRYQDQLDLIRILHPRDDPKLGHRPDSALPLENVPDNSVYRLPSDDAVGQVNAATTDEGKAGEEKKEEDQADEEISVVYNGFETDEDGF